MAGELLAQMEKARGGRPCQGAYRSEDATGKAIADLGITKDQSSQWQQLAANFAVEGLTIG